MGLLPSQRHKFELQRYRLNGANVHKNLSRGRSHSRKSSPPHMGQVWLAMLDLMVDTLQSFYTNHFEPFKSTGTSDGIAIGGAVHKDC